MRYVSFHRDGAVVPGIVEDDRIRALSCDSLVEYIALDERRRDACRTARTYPLDGAQLAAPVRPNKNVYCVGRNYLEHAREGARAAGRDLKLPEVPTFFSKAPTAIADPDSQLPLAARISSEYDWEGELAVVIGRRIKDVAEERAMEAIFGYTCLNDVTARDLQRAHLQWLKGKSLDHTCPLGPWIVGTDEIADPHKLHSPRA